jgi:hypothetical protein
MPKRVTTEDFIERAKAVHGDSYDYSLAEYQGIHKYVTIVCRKHGQFQQSPANHYQGKGCSVCGGSRPHTTESFIDAAQSVHSDRYDYSQVEYVNNKTVVTIICRLHGPFSQVAKVHICGGGCPECAGVKKHNTQSFIEKARDVHGDRYDYSKVDYESSHAPVSIICPNHGPFTQSPSNHFAGKGCNECGNLAAGDARRKTTEQFITKANAVHGDSYDYSLIDYVGSAVKVTIICSDHGPFDQTPSEHLVGSGCTKCGRLAAGDARRKTTEQFITKANAVHGDCYDYSLVEYLGVQEKVTIICPEHGPFDQTPSGHLAAKGCYECGIVASGAVKRGTTEQFIAKAKMVHGDRYDYSLVEYVTSSKQIKIICPDHGLFLQRPNDHISGGSGCADCAKSGFNPSEPGILYYVAVTTDDGDTCYKIGITNHSIDERFPATDLARIRVVKMWRFATGHRAAERESEILYQFPGDRYYGPRLLVSGGNTEIFTHDVLGLDNPNKEVGQSFVDTDAKLTSRQIQGDFDFSEV